jgi:hypothetical protein
LLTQSGLAAPYLFSSVVYNKSNLSSDVKHSSGEGFYMHLMFTKPWAIQITIPPFFRYKILKKRSIPCDQDCSAKKWQNQKYKHRMINSGI